MTTSPNEFAFADFAAALAKAHAAGEPAVDFLEAGAVPSTVPEGMAVQAEVAQRLGASVAGWKVGAGPERIPDGAPLYTHLVRESGANFPVRKRNAFCYWSKPLHSCTILNANRKTMHTRDLCMPKHS
ncbi:MAG: hypothetical protein P8Y36_01805 [Alphaproteobacteria bacterium]